MTEPLVGESIGAMIGDKFSTIPSDQSSSGTLRCDNIAAILEISNKGTQRVDLGASAQSAPSNGLAELVNSNKSPLPTNRPNGMA